jgi:hypothetical protein
MIGKPNISESTLALILSPLLASVLFLHVEASGQDTDPAPQSVNAETTPNQPAQQRTVSPRRRSVNPRPSRTQPPAKFPIEFRNISGGANNTSNPSWGSANIPFLRLTTVGYDNGSGSPAGGGGPSARLISNWCAAQDGNILNQSGYTDMMWQWGQFLDHDLDLTPVVNPLEPFDIRVPNGDPWFDPNGTGQNTIPLDRSAYTMRKGLREQINGISAFIDASNVYGSNGNRTNELRTLDGTGMLKTSPGNLLPFNSNGFPNAPESDDSSFFLAGDFRANEQVGLTAMHTLWVREHNKWAHFMKLMRPNADGAELFQYARAVVVAEMQVITYKEFLPILLGPTPLNSYGDYKSAVNPGIANVFATAAYRFGHTMLSPTMLRLNSSGGHMPGGPISLADAFFNPVEIRTNGIEPILRGLASQQAQEVDMYCVDEVRNFLFGPPGGGGLDLASLNIQRGRDHGLPSYNQVRIDYGLPPVTSFAQINQDVKVRQNLQAVYQNVDQIDIWVGGLAEAHVPGAIVGPTFHRILKDQFERLRDGDRFWYETYLPAGVVTFLEKQKLSRIIWRNTNIDDEINEDVFRIAN